MMGTRGRGGTKVPPRPGGGGAGGGGLLEPLWKQKNRGKGRTTVRWSAWGAGFTRGSMPWRGLAVPRSDGSDWVAGGARGQGQDGRVTFQSR